MVLQRATQNGQIAFPATALPVNVTVTAFPLRDGRFPGGGSSTTRVNPDARNLLVFFLGEKSPNGDNMEHFWRKFSFTSRKRSPKFSLCFLFFWAGRGGGREVVPAGLSAGELYLNRSEQKCRQLS
jgi:hypothetical protein